MFRFGSRSTNSRIDAHPLWSGIAAVFVVAFATLAPLKTAATEAGPLLSDGELRALREFLRPHVYALRRPVTLYHWFDAGNDARWTGTLEADSRRGYDYVRENGGAYWDNLHEGTQRGSFGTGLYAAIDPVSSRTFGKVPNWVLVQMRIPSGLRLLDLRRDGNSPLPLGLEESLGKLSCFPSGPAIPSLQNLLMPDTKRSAACNAVLRGIFDGDFRIDAFAYPYFSASFRECTTTAPRTFPGAFSGGWMSAAGELRERDERNTAFVITDPKRLLPQDVRVFNSQTRGEPQDRRRIQSLFYRALHDRLPSPVTGPSGTANGAWPTATPNAAAPSPAATPPYPTTISASGVDSSKFPMGVTSGIPDSVAGLHWADLDGKPTDPEIGAWIRENLFGCAEGSPYVSQFRLDELLKPDCLNADTAPRAEIERVLAPLNDSIGKKLR